MRVIEHARACGARPRLRRLQQALRACDRRCALATGAARLFFFLLFSFLLFTPAGDRTSSRLRHSARHARAFGARSRRCAPAAGAARLPQALRLQRRCAPPNMKKSQKSVRSPLLDCILLLCAPA
jgi:hypothetical protein